jgi:hypothetical protein
VARQIALANALFLLVFVLGCAAKSSSAPDRARAGAGGSAGQANDAGQADDAGGSAGQADDAGGMAGAGGSAGQTDTGTAGEAGSHEVVPINGVDLALWDRYLSQPTSGEPALGLNNDPSGVYSIVTLEGEPAIRISGEVWGSLISKREFCNFRLRAEFKWGSFVGPRLNARDSGIMFLSTGPLGAVEAGGNSLSAPIGSGSFMVAPECQIIVGDVGGLVNLGPVAFNATNTGDRTELPTPWNAIMISFLDDQATVSLNGHETVRASGFTINWPDTGSAALRCGKLQLQSEGSEIFFRRVEIEPLP